MFGPLRKRGSFSMTQSNSVDMTLVNQVVEQIPDWTWDSVCQLLVPAIVDDMPGFVVEKLTGTQENFDRAEEILFDYYRPIEKKHKLIADSFSLIGTEVTVTMLMALQLDQLEPKVTNEV